MHTLTSAGCFGFILTSIMAATRRDVEDVYNSLATVGLPPSVSLEQFTRLYRAKLADALSFMSQSMLGRTPVSQARKRISEMYIYNSCSHRCI